MHAAASKTSRRIPILNISLIILGLMFVFTGCNINDDEPYVPSTSGNNGPNTNGNAQLLGNGTPASYGNIVTMGSVNAVTESGTNLRDVACRMEIPRLKGGSDNLFIVHTVPTYGVNYCMEYNYTLRAQWWSAFRWDNSNTLKTVSRTDAWAPDPLIPKAYQTNQSDYSGSGYTRGHIVASEDRVNSRQANEQTFYYSNMQPQFYGFNTEGIWWNVENRLIRDKYNTKLFRDTLYVVKGGTIAQGKYQMVKGIPAPDYFFVALLCKRNDIPENNGYSAIAFWMRHTANTDDNYKNYAVSIDRLEELTGIDFFCNLPDDIENAVENKLDYSKWKLN